MNDIHDIVNFHDAGFILMVSSTGNFLFRRLNESALVNNIIKWETSESIVSLFYKSLTFTEEQKLDITAIECIRPFVYLIAMYKIDKKLILSIKRPEYNIGLTSFGLWFNQIYDMLLK